VARSSSEVRDAVVKVLEDDRWSWEEEGYDGGNQRDSTGTACDILLTVS